VEELDASEASGTYTRQRLEEMLVFFEIVTKSYDQVRDMSKDELLRLFKLGETLKKLLGS
jgi:hypothetical protein